MTKKELKWRLKESPTAEGVARLVEQKVITPEEAREIILKSEEASEVSDLKEQIDFLKRTIEALQKQRDIVYVPQRYIERPWYTPNVTWMCDTGGSNINYVASSNGKYGLGTSDTVIS